MSKQDGKYLHRFDITGMRSGKLTAIKKVGYGTDKAGKRYALWECKCDCGGSKICKQHTIVCGEVKSCGCLSKRDYTKKTINHGLSRHRIYGIYHGMINRCEKENDMHYKFYGAKGIKVCDEWKGENGFINFYLWSMDNGYGDDLSIDRIDNNGNYEPDNCRWADAFTQANNTSANVYYEIDGTQAQIKEISKFYGIPEPTLRGRMKKGMSMREAVYYKMPLKSITYHVETKTAAEWSKITGISKATLLDRIKRGYTEDEIFLPIQTKRKRK